MIDEKTMGQVIQIDEARIRDHLGEMVRGTVEETLNAMLDAEADRLCGAGCYERSEARQDTRAGSYERTLHTKAGDVSLKAPKLRRQTFETAIIERYRRRESSVEEALIEMYLAGISVRRVEDITEALWGTRVAPSSAARIDKNRLALPEPRRLRHKAHLKFVASQPCLVCGRQPSDPPPALCPAPSYRHEGERRVQRPSAAAITGSCIRRATRSPGGRISASDHWRSPECCGRRPIRIPHR